MLCCVCCVFFTSTEVSCTLEYRKGIANKNKSADVLPRSTEPAAEHDRPQWTEHTSPPSRTAVSSSSKPAGFALALHR